MDQRHGSVRGQVCRVGPQYTAVIGNTRQRDPLKRRRELCDAAIEILGESGAKGLSHLKVDRRAGVPDGSTSFYFRTRSALVRAVAERLAQRDYDILLSVLDRTRDHDGTPAQRTPSALATRLVAMAREPFRTQVKARYEFFMLATRDSEVGAMFQRNIDLEFELLRHFVLRLQPPDAAVDDAVVDDQALAVMAMISGITLTLVAGDPSFRDPAKIDRFLLAAVTGIGAAHAQENLSAGTDGQLESKERVPATLASRR